MSDPLGAAFLIAGGYAVHKLAKCSRKRREDEARRVDEVTRAVAARIEAEQAKVQRERRRVSRRCNQCGDGGATRFGGNGYYCEDCYRMLYD